MDPLTDVFKTLRVSALVHAKVEATAPWGLLHEPNVLAAYAIEKKHSPLHLANFAMVARGNCWLVVEGMSDPIPLTGGDCFFVAPGGVFSLRDDPRTPAVSFCGAAPSDGSGNIRCGGGGAPTEIISGLLAFEAITVKPIRQLLPPLILIKADQARTVALHTTMQMLAAEMAAPAPGSEVVVNRLAEVLFIQTMRAHIAAGASTCKQGWLRAIFDVQIGSALRAIHEDVNTPWTLERLADAAGMSRSAFAARFKELLGQTPLEYVTDWRMHKALPLLRADRKLIDIARSVGYESDAAFNKAFKRVLGITPGEYRRGHAAVTS